MEPNEADFDDGTVLGNESEEHPTGSRIERRRLLKNLGMATGAAVASTWVIDSFTSPVSAAQGWSAIVCGPDNTVTIPRKRDVYFDIAGGGGQGGGRGSGGFDGGDGGSGARIMGKIDAQSNSYVLTVHSATGGSQYDPDSGLTRPWDWPGFGGTGYARGGRAGDQHQLSNEHQIGNIDPRYGIDSTNESNLSSEWAGCGGGGAGSSAITGPNGIVIIAAGGGGGGGGSGHSDTDNGHKNGFGGAGGAGGSANDAGSNGNGGYDGERGRGGGSGPSGGHAVDLYNVTGGFNNRWNDYSVSPYSDNHQGWALGTDQGADRYGAFKPQGTGGHGGDGFNYWEVFNPKIGTGAVDTDTRVSFDSGGGGGGGAGAVGGGGGSGGGHNKISNGTHYIGAGGGGGGASSSVAGGGVTHDPINHTGGGTGGLGANGNKTAGQAGGPGWVRIYLNSPGNQDITESCIYP